MADFHREASVRRCCASIATRVRFDADLSETSLSALRCAIIFVHAFWSGPSVQALSKLADILGVVDPKGAIEIVVCDIDQIAGHTGPPYKLDALSGMGEILWMKDGEIRAHHNCKRQCDVKVTTLSLLAECRT